MNSPEDDDDCITNIPCCGARKAKNDDVIQTLHDYFGEEDEEGAECAQPLLGGSGATASTARLSETRTSALFFGRPPAGRNVCRGADADPDDDDYAGQPLEMAPELPSGSERSSAADSGVREAADGETPSQTLLPPASQRNLCGAMDVIALHEEEQERRRLESPGPEHAAEAPQTLALDLSLLEGAFYEVSYCEADADRKAPQTPPSKSSARRKCDADAASREDSGKLLLTPISVDTVRSPGLISEPSTALTTRSGDVSHSTARGRRGLDQRQLLTPMSLATESPGSVRAKKGSASRYFRPEDLPDFLLRTPDSMITDCHTAVRRMPSPRRSRSCSSFGGGEDCQTAARRMTPSPRRSRSCSSFGASEGCNEGVDGIEKRLPRAGLVARLFGEEAGFGGPHARSELMGPLWWPGDFSSNSLV